MKKKMIFSLLAAGMFMLLATGCVKAVPIGEEGKVTGEVAFNAGDSVTELWEGAVANIEEKAVDLPAFLTEANGDLKSLADKYGKYSMGNTGTISYAVKGSGTVTEVNQEKKAGYMTVALNDYSGSETIRIQIGSIYKGSSTRDTLDIVNFGDYTNQEEWAAISQELHTKIDETVVKAADPSSIQGKTIEFVGTFTADSDDDLLITAVRLDVK